MFFGVSGEPGGMPGTPHGQTQPGEAILDDFWSSFGRLWGGPGRPGGDQESPKSLADAAPEAY